jgi:hypothetical protein
MIWTIAAVMIVVWLFRLLTGYARKVRSRHIDDRCYRYDSRLHSGATRAGSRKFYLTQFSCPIKAIRKREF